MHFGKSQMQLGRNRRPGWHAELLCPVTSQIPTTGNGNTSRILSWTRSFILSLTFKLLWGLFLSCHWMKFCTGLITFLLTFRDKYSIILSVKVLSPHDNKNNTFILSLIFLLPQIGSSSEQEAAGQKLLFCSVLVLLFFPLFLSIHQDWSESQVEVWWIRARDLTLGPHGALGLDSLS